MTIDMKTNDQLLEDAKAAASKLHGDMSVSKRATVEALRDLVGHVETLIEATEADIEREEE
jgi:hypothetical protein